MPAGAIDVFAPVILMLTPLQAATEELVFRGYLMQSLRTFTSVRSDCHGPAAWFFTVPPCGIRRPHMVVGHCAVRNDAIFFAMNTCATGAWSLPSARMPAVTFLSPYREYIGFGTRQPRAFHGQRVRSRLLDGEPDGGLHTVLCLVFLRRSREIVNTHLSVKPNSSNSRATDMRLCGGWRLPLPWRRARSGAEASCRTAVPVSMKRHTLSRCATSFAAPGGRTVRRLLQA